MTGWRNPHSNPPTDSGDCKVANWPKPSKLPPNAHAEDTIQRHQNLCTAIWRLQGIGASLKSSYAGGKSKKYHRVPVYLLTPSFSDVAGKAPREVILVSFLLQCNKLDLCSAA